MTSNSIELIIGRADRHDRGSEAEDSEQGGHPTCPADLENIT